MARHVDELRTAASAVSADQDAPSALDTPSEAGFDCNGWSDLSVYITAATESDTCTIRPWYWSGSGWHKGSSESVTGSTVVTLATLHDRVYLQLVSVSGTFTVSYRRIRLET